MDSQSISDCATTSSKICDICHLPSEEDYLIGYEYCNDCIARDNIANSVSVSYDVPTRICCYGCNNMMRVVNASSIKLCLDCDCRLASV